MKVNVQADTQQAVKGDPRITKLGHFLRKTSIDELPQFINVLIGSMSVVGPRPHMLRHTDEYSKLIEQFMGRHYVKPGITGLAQCLGYRGETKDLIDMENRVRMDRYYIENWTFWFDVKIIFLTIVSLIRGSDKAF
jgi:lipopolysaccharide/colanic/teichoic acid biosynthesis glycosyltransferase